MKKATSSFTNLQLQKQKKKPALKIPRTRKKMASPAPTPTSSASAAAANAAAVAASSATTDSPGVKMMTSSSAGVSGTATTVTTASAAAAGGTSKVDRDQICKWILQLQNRDSREEALLELSKKRESVADLAPMLWHSFGTIAALLQEIINIYPAINPPTLNAHQSNRVCNALALLQCVASHPETRSVFLLAHIPLYLYPFLQTTAKSRPFEYLRLTSLGVIGALVKTDENDVINFLLTTEIIPLCLKIMEAGSELSKTVATFILQKILLDDHGLYYICQTYDRFSHVAMILGKMVIALAKEPSARLLKHVIRCYLRLSDNERACEALCHCLPDQLKDETFAACLKDDKVTKHGLAQLLKNLEKMESNNSGGGGGGSSGGPNLQQQQQQAQQQGLKPSNSGDMRKLPGSVF